MKCPTKSRGNAYGSEKTLQAYVARMTALDGIPSITFIRSKDKRELFENKHTLEPRYCHVLSK